MGFSAQHTGIHSDVFRARSLAIVTWVLVFSCSCFLSFAGSDGSLRLESPRVITNDDLPDPGLIPPVQGDAGDSTFLMATLPVFGPPEIGGTAPVALERRTAGSQMTVPDLLAEFDRLQRRRMRLVVPFLSRRFAVTAPEERAAEQGLDNRTRLALLQARLDEIHMRLSEAGVETPSSRFGRPAPLVVSGFGESPPLRVSIADGPPFRWEHVAKAEGSDRSRGRLFRRLEEFTAFVTVAGSGATE